MTMAVSRNPRELLPSMRLPPLSSAPNSLSSWMLYSALTSDIEMFVISSLAPFVQALNSSHRLNSGLVKYKRQPGRRLIK